MSYKGTLDSFNFPAKDALIRKQIDMGLFLSIFTGNVQTDLISKDDGQKIRMVTGMSGNVVEKVGNVFQAEGTDHLLIPMVKPLNEDPLYGDAYLPGTGEELDYRWMQIYINQIAKGVVQKRGNMDKIRTDVLEKYYKQASPALINYMRREKDAQMIAALYHGFSHNVLAGLNNSPNGIGAKAVFHPNLYKNEYNDETSSGEIVKIGDERTTKTVTQMNSSIHSGYSSLKPISVRMLYKLAEKLESLLIPKTVTYNGVAYYLAVIDKKMLTTLKMDDNFIKTFQYAFMGKEYNNPLFKNEAYIFDEFLLVVHEKTTRAWNYDTSDFAGTNGFRGIKTAASGKDNGVISVLGDSSMLYGIPTPLYTEPDITNVGQQRELFGIEISGSKRCDYIAKGDNASYYSIGNPDEDTNSNPIAAYNNSSLQLVVAE